MLLTTEKLSKAYESRKKGEPVFWAAKGGVSWKFRRERP